MTPVNPVAVEQVAGAALGRRALAPLILLCLGHFAVDVYSGALGALQPLLVERFGITLTQVGILGGLMVFSSSVMQPAYGYLSDRFHTRMFVVAAPAVAGAFISALGLAPSYGWLLLLVLVGGAGVAAFHPQASSRAALGVTEGRAGAMAFFVSSGTLGYALGPTYFTLITGRFGLAGSWTGAIPGILLSVLLFLALPAAPRAASHRQAGFHWEELRRFWKPLALLYVLVFLRSVIQIVFGQFLPLYLHLARGYPVRQANYLMSAYLVSGALGGFLGGHAADRWGGRTVIAFSMLASAPFLALFFFGSGLWAVAGLLLGGFILLFTIPVNVVMAQELVPSQAGTVSALMMGFAWGMAGMVFIPLVGYAADAFSLHGVLASLVVFPMIGFLIALRLPK